MIKIYGKPGCGKCEAAKEKLKLLGLEFESCNLSDFVVWHENWRQDESVTVLAFYSKIHNHMPIISIDGELYEYEGAMKVLKGKQ
ncbi:MAG: glutaredoxin domain-containing protein [Smithella sp.]|jgi:glutaredoxin